MTNQKAMVCPTRSTMSVMKPQIDAATADLQFALRTLRKGPAFAIAAVVTPALGMGANTAIFSVLNATFLRPLPFAYPERPQGFERLEAYGTGAGVNLAGESQATERLGPATSARFLYHAGGSTSTRKDIPAGRRSAGLRSRRDRRRCAVAELLPRRSADCARDDRAERRAGDNRRGDAAEVHGPWRGRYRSVSRRLHSRTAGN